MPNSESNRKIIRYCFQWYDNNTKKYQPGASFSDLLQLYTFDSKLSQLVFSFASQIEISLRARFIDAIIRFVGLKARIQKSNTFPRQVFVTRGSVFVFGFFISSSVQTRLCGHPHEVPAFRHAVLYHSLSFCPGASRIERASGVENKRVLW